MTSTGDDDGANRAPDRDGGIESARMHLESIAAELEARVELASTDQATLELLSDARRTEQSLRFAVAALAGHASATVVASIVDAIDRIDAVECALSVKRRVLSDR